jgi:hypothetical protein
MFRLVPSAMAFAGILATTLPASAGPSPAPAATASPAPAAPARLSQPAAPEPHGRNAEIIPVGPGWGWY